LEALPRRASLKDDVFLLATRKLLLKPLSNPAAFSSSYIHVARIYRIYFPESGRIVQARDVKLDEARFNQLPTVDFDEEKPYKVAAIETAPDTWTSRPGIRFVEPFKVNGEPHQPGPVPPTGRGGGPSDQNAYIITSIEEVSNDAVVNPSNYQRQATTKSCES
jgi:hypothetical protein